MLIVKPIALSLGTRTFQYAGRRGLAVTAMIYFPFRPAERTALWTEGSMWNFVAAQMATSLLDEGLPKAVPEFFVHGAAFPPARPAPSCLVEAAFGQRRKAIAVFGDRTWQGRAASAPQPFERMPLEWSRAFGGAGIEANPAGVGAPPAGAASVDAVRALPNLERPDALIERPDQAVAPACYAPLDSMHPQRVQFRGTYDATWLQKHAPALPPDFDWRFFNLAPSDQWLDREPAPGDRFEFVNLNPHQPRLAGALPALAARCLVRMRDEADALRDLPMRLSTVWFFPEFERGILIFHGVTEIASDDASDVVLLAGAIEAPGARKPLQHYADVVRQRSDPRFGHVYALRDRDLLPAGIDRADPEFDRARQELRGGEVRADAARRAAQREVRSARARALACGADPDVLGLAMPAPEPMPAPDDLPEYLERTLPALLQKQVQEIDAAFTTARQVAEDCAARGIDMAAADRGGPPRPLLQARGTLPSGVGSALRMGYLQGAHAQLPAPTLAMRASAAARDAVAHAAASRAPLIAASLTGADLSGLDLSGLDLTGAWLESANLAHCKLTGADLSYAVIAHANLRGVDATGARLRGANLGGATLQGACFDGADFAGAILLKQQFDGVRMRGAILRDAQFVDATFGACDCREIDASGAVFHRRDLRGVDFTAARLRNATFIECRLDGARFSGAQLQQATFVDCRAAGIDCERADLAGAVFAGKCDLQGAQLAGATLRGANLRGACLAHACLAGAQLDECDISEADLTGADLRAASLQRALAIRTDWTGAALAAANFKDALLSHGDFRGADAARCNFYGSDLASIRHDAASRFDGALFVRARIDPRWQAGAA